MRIFSKLYERAMQWAAHQHAPYYLAGLSFCEASFFPIPPDVVMAPMTLANPDKAWRYAMLTTAFSVLGSLVGYLIGMFFFALIHPYLIELGYMHAYTTVQHWFVAWGFLALLLAGFSPIPFKLFTIAAGASHMPMAVFVLGAIVGRSMRFYLVTALIKWGGERMEQALKRYIDYLGWGLLVIIAVGYFIWR